MPNSEQLRETLVAIQRENERLRVESAHATLLFRALESLLKVEIEEDPFAAVFAALGTIFDFSQAMVLAEVHSGGLVCIAAVPASLTGVSWKRGGLFNRVMDGRVSVTISNEQLVEWQDAPTELSVRQPALYLPIRVRDRRGLLMLLQPADSPGFDRNHVALARKFSLLASHALATREAREVEIALQRKQEIEIQNTRFDAALNNMNHGLAMFDAGHRLVVCNRQYIEMYRLSPEVVKPGCDLVDLLRQRERGGTLPDAVNDYMEALVSSMARGIVLEREVEYSDGRIFRIVNRPMRTGGWVATHEDITERRRNELRVKFLALNDPLTGIANRSNFVENIEAARERLRDCGEPFAIFILDLDKFKDVNDTLGHAAGDTLLKEAAQRLRESIRDSDLLARLGGDEFAIIQRFRRGPGHSIDSSAQLRQQATGLTQRILRLIGEPFEVDGQKLSIGTSIGIAIAPDDATEAGELMKKADLALYAVKSKGRNGICFFEAAMTEQADERRLLENDLRNAISRNEFVLHYQPIVDVATGRICGAEALVRWNHPRLGLLPPARFISIAEDTGLIVPLGERILKAACVDAANWPRHLKVAVNISPVQFGNKELYESVSQALAHSGLSPERLELEITERLLLEQNADHSLVLRQLKELGITIALDDFGTGYSSLTYLKTFPIDKLKIDRSFTSDLLVRADCAAIVSTIINLGRLLDVMTVAEGVETSEQFEMLKTAGVTQVQGFFLYHPMPVSQFAAIVGNSTHQGWAAA